MMKFELVPGRCFLHSWTSFTGPVRFHLLEKIAGTNGKVGPNPRLISIEYTFKSDGWNISYIVIQYINDSLGGFPRSLYKYPLKPGQGPQNRGGNGGMCPPPPLFLKWKKYPFGGLKCPIYRTKKVFLEWTPSRSLGRNRRPEDNQLQEARNPG
jgi:hypothetical protein